MFNGRDYKFSFDEACEDLPFIKDSTEIRNRLTSIEWVLEEAIRGAFHLQSLLLSTLLIFPIGYFLSIGSANRQEQILFIALFVAVGVLNYWLSKFAFWYEISRHLGNRRFGENKSIN